MTKSWSEFLSGHSGISGSSQVNLGSRELRSLAHLWNMEAFPKGLLESSENGKYFLYLTSHGPHNSTTQKTTLVSINRAEDNVLNYKKHNFSKTMFN